MKFIVVLVFSTLILCSEAGAQQPRYTKKHFVNYSDTIEFRRSETGELINTYILASVQILDVDDDNTTIVKGGTLCLLNITGPVVNGKREGVFTTYVIDSADHSRRYKIYEQTFKNDGLNGEWKTFNIKGTLVMISNFKNNQPYGLERTFWIDGVRIMNEKNYINGKDEFIEKDFYDNGKPNSELHIKNNKYNGLCRYFYEDGSLQREAVFKDGVPDGMYKYYYPGGKLWIEQIYKDGVQWTVVGNYSRNGKPREKGTLKNGNGTVYYYEEDGSLREIVTFVNGEVKKH